MKYLSTLLCSFSLLLATNATADERPTPTAADDALRRLKVSQDIPMLSEASFGASLSLAHGSLDVQVTDLRISGTGPDIILSRTFQGENYSFSNYANMGDWLFDRPYIFTTVVSARNKTTYSGSWGKQRACSGELSPGSFFSSYGSVDQNAYWNGDFVFIPGHGQQLMLQTTAADGSFQRQTKENIRLHCFMINPSVPNQGEGFIATTPDGTQYKFEIFDFRSKKTTMPSQPANISFQQVMLYATEVKDLRGNWIRYNYNASDKKLNSITASDGRLVQFTYGTGFDANNITTIEYAGQQWLYSYQRGDKNTLVKVTRPDNKFWQYDMRFLTEQYPGSSSADNGTVNCPRALHLDSQGIGKVSMVNPEGASLSYQFSCVFFGRANVYPKAQTLNGIQYFVPPNVGNFAVRSKVLSPQPGVEYQSSYSYLGGLGYATNPGPGSGNGLAVIPPEGVATYLHNASKETLPDGAVRISYFNREFDSFKEGRMVAEQFFNPSGQLVRSTWSDYVKGNAVGDFELIGENRSSKIFRVLPSAQRSVEGLQSQPLQVNYDLYDDYGFAKVERRQRSDGTSVEYHKTYLHQPGPWLIGLPTSVSVMDQQQLRQISATSYYPLDSAAMGLPYQQFRFGKLQTTNAYDSAGNLQQITYAGVNNRWVRFSDYYRGVARNIVLPHPDSTATVSARIETDEFGRALSVTDFSGVQTNYSYDAVGRLLRIQPSDLRWLATEISYPQENGLLTQQISRGAARHHIQFDGLLRPTLRKQWDANNEAGTVSYTRHSYDYQNQLVFSSLPATSANETRGHSTSYDQFGRLVQTIDPDGNKVSVDYLSGYEKQVTDAKGYQTRTSYLASGTPDYNQPMQIEAPEGQLTKLSYNIYGNPVLITQGGVTESRIYDSAQQLCVLNRPDVGTDAYAYNQIGELIYQVSGLAEQRGCLDVAATSGRTSFSYNQHGRLVLTDYADASPDKVAVFDAMGQLTRLKAGNSEWNYTYNSQGLIETENLTVDNLSWILDPSYNSLGHMDSITYPSGKSIQYAPNALGQVTRVGDYATAATYFPNGQLQGFSYGNGLKFSQTLDSQQRTEYQTVARSGTALLNHRYQYDVNHNIDTIRDLVAPTKNISLGYDGLDRLITASGIWGSGNFSYDAIGNLKSKTLGSQSLTYNYNGRNQLSSVGGSLSRSFSYDSRGHVTNNSQRSFSFNLANQLASSGTTSYQYDGYNRRVKKQSNGKTQYSLYNAAGQLMMTSGEQGPTEYFYLGNKLVAKESQVLTTEDTPGYTGHLEDDELGLTYMQQRYYDPVIGRFYSNDPVGFSADNPMMFNRYAYANNNPYKFTDPDGRVAMLIGAGIGALVDVGIQVASNMASGQGFGEAVSNIDPASVAVSAGLGAVGQFGGASAATKVVSGMSNASKGKIGEAVARAGIAARGEKVIASQGKAGEHIAGVSGRGAKAVPDFIVQDKNGGVKVVEAKFGSAQLTGAQRDLKNQMGDAFSVSRTTYKDVANAGGAAGAVAGGAAGNCVSGSSGPCSR